MECKKCGEIVEGNFCPKCDNNVDKKVKKVKDCKDKKESLCKIERIANPIIFIVAFVSLLIFTFFIGTTKFSNNQTNNFDVFYFFSQKFKDTATMFESYGDRNGIGFYNFGYFIYTIIDVLILLIIIANFAIQIIMSILGTKESVKALCSNQSSNAYKYLIISFVSFVFTAVIIYQCTYTIFYRIYSGTEIKRSVSMNAGSILGIILGGLAVISSLIIKILVKGKEFFELQNFKKFIPLAVGFVIVFVASLLYNEFININGKITYEAWSSYMLLFMGINGLLLWPSPMSYLMITIMGFITVLINIGVTGLLLYMAKGFLDGMFNGNVQEKNLFVISITTTALVILSLILTSIIIVGIIQITQLDLSTNMYIGTGIIVVLILSVLALVSTITYSLLNKKTYTLN